MNPTKKILALVVTTSSLGACSQASYTSTAASLPAVFSLSSKDMFEAAETSPYRATIAAQIKAMSLEQYYQVLTHITNNDKVVVDSTDVFSDSLKNLEATHDLFTQLGASFPTVGAAWESVHFDPETWSYQGFKGTLDAMGAAARGPALSLVDTKTQNLPPVELKPTTPGDACSIQLQVLYNLGVGEKHLMYMVNAWRNLSSSRFPILAGVFTSKGSDGEVDLEGDRAYPSLVYYPHGWTHPDGKEDDSGAFTKGCTQPVQSTPPPVAAAEKAATS